VPAFSVAPITATDFGEKNTSNWFRWLTDFRFLEAFIASMTLGVLGFSEGGTVQGLDHVGGGEAGFSRGGFDVAVVAGRADAQLLENGCRLRIFLLDVADDHARMDQAIESEHSFSPRTFSTLDTKILPDFRSQFLNALGLFR
jgi:hypothetical protein